MNVTIPPILLVVLKVLCSFVANMPPPWGPIFATVCGLLPKNFGTEAAITLQMPSELVEAIKATELPAAGTGASEAATMLKDAVKTSSAASPCGCKD